LISLCNCSMAIWLHFKLSKIAFYLLAISMFNNYSLQFHALEIMSLLWKKKSVMDIIKQEEEKKNLHLLYSSYDCNKSKKIDKKKKGSHLNLARKMDKRNLWRNNGCIGRNQTSFRKVSKFWHISLTLLSNHLNGKIRSRKVSPIIVITNKEDKIIVIWEGKIGDFGLFCNCWK
jgi:hypothetical protein